MENLVVHVVRTGTANLASIAAGLRRAGATPQLVENRGEVLRADLLVVPGVGTLAAAIQRLEQSDFIAPLRDRILSNRPTLSVCLGMQLLCEDSEESRGVKGLGCVSERVTRFPKGKRIPQLGWNRVRAPLDARFLEDGYFYFANSYCLRETPNGWRGATADYGVRFVAAMEKGSQLACQFHPELSGKAGLRLIKRWLETSRNEGEKLC